MSDVTRILSQIEQGERSDFVCQPSRTLVEMPAGTGNDTSSRVSSAWRASSSRSSRLNALTNHSPNAGLRERDTSSAPRASAPKVIKSKQLARARSMNDASSTTGRQGKSNSAKGGSQPGKLSHNELSHNKRQADIKGGRRPQLLGCIDSNSPPVSNHAPLFTIHHEQVVHPRRNREPVAGRGALPASLTDEYACVGECC